MTGFVHLSLITAEAGLGWAGGDTVPRLSDLKQAEQC